MIDMYGEAEPALPLPDLSLIKLGDALKVTWPQTDSIIGNPPFLGAKFVRPNFGDEYANWLMREFDVGVKDFCVYWFRKAHEHLQPGQRAGLVGTNSVSQTGGRAASLEYIVSNDGVITDAVSSQKWPGDAKVHVSLVNWVKAPVNGQQGFVLDGIQVPGITSQLRDERVSGASEPAQLSANAGRCFAGVVPQGKGFVVSDDVANGLLAESKVDYSRVVRRFLTGDDLAARPSRTASRWIVDFASMPLEEASRYPDALSILRRSVRTEREASENRAVENRWWLFGRRVPAMRHAIDSLARYAGAASTGKRFIVDWQAPEVLPNNAVCVFAVEDDFSMGVLMSGAHVAWAWARSSTLKGDLRYTSAAVFMTFPWPSPVTDEQRERVAKASRRLLARRAEICATEQIGLTKLYNAVDEGGCYAAVAVMPRWPTILEGSQA